MLKIDKIQYMILYNHKLWVIIGLKNYAQNR